MPPLQCNAAKTISVLKELFSKHGIPETLRSDNGPQFTSHLFTEFTKEWNFDNNTSSPRNPRSNGQAEATIKIIKGLLTHAKYSGQDPFLPCWHKGAHPLMPTSAHQLRCSTRGPSTPHYHKGYITGIPMLQMTMIDSTNVPCRVS